MNKLSIISVAILAVIFSNIVNADEYAPLEFAYNDFSGNEKFYWEDLDRKGFVQAKISNIYPCAASSNLGSICADLLYSCCTDKQINVIFETKFKKRDLNSLKGYNYLYGQVEKRERATSNYYEPLFVVKYIKGPIFKGIKAFADEYLKRLEILSNTNTLCLKDYRKFRYEFGFVDTRTGHALKFEESPVSFSRELYEFWQKEPFPIENESVLYGLEFENKQLNSMNQIEKNIIKGIIATIKSAERKVLKKVEC